MEKDQYLRNAEVASFIDWLVHRLDTPNSFKHSWVSLIKMGSLEKGGIWECDSLYSAYEQYVWRSSNIRTCKRLEDFNSTESYLKKMSNDLKCELAKDNPDELKVKLLCIEILIWGGVNKPKIATFLRGNGLYRDLDIAQYLKQVQRFFSTPIDTSTNDYMVTVNGKAVPIEIDSGTTKILALICDDFIIYDSRVGAAIAYLVRLWSEKSQSGIPKILQFRWGLDSSKVAKLYNRRNPDYGNDNSVFKVFSDTSGGLDKRIERLNYNIYANWILTECVNRSSKLTALSTSHALRALEAALFMVGYTINQSKRVGKHIPNKTNHRATRNANAKIIYEYVVENKGVLSSLFGYSDVFALAGKLLDATRQGNNYATARFLQLYCDTEAQFIEDKKAFDSSGVHGNQYLNDAKTIWRFRLRE
ncbi:MAG: hypothetical protein V2I33_01125 [Kangiellaceae bacterium]|jgi:hypothetical protein|nr:hypothetical protein [Kangiellaceae bacterium]